jgi:CRP-like cAMP-binding protein
MDEKVRNIIQLVALLEAKPVMLKAGQVLFDQGQPGTQMFVVQSGALEFKVSGNVVGTAGPGD